MEGRVLLGLKAYPESARSCGSWCPPVLAIVPSLGMALGKSLLVSPWRWGMCVPATGHAPRTAGLW